jgi:hypothetical protein
MNSLNTFNGQYQSTISDLATSAAYYAALKQKGTGAGSEFGF